MSRRRPGAQVTPRCAVVCDRGHAKIKVTTIYLGASGPRIGAGGRRNKRHLSTGTAMPTYPVSEETPDGGSKVRIPQCPRCGLDVALSWERFRQLTNGLADGGVSEVTLAAIARIVSTQ